MYSLVLMMALGNGATVPSFENDAIRPQATPIANHEHRQERHRRGGCNGCNGGGGGCHGGGGGCWGGGGCYGGGHSCCGGRYGGYYGGYGGSGGGYYGSPYVYGPSYWGGSSTMYGTGYYASPGYYGGTEFYGAPYGDTGYYGTGRANVPMPRESGFDQNRANQNLQDMNAPGTDQNFQNRGTQPGFGTPPRNPNATPPAASPTPNRPGDGSGLPRQEGRLPAPATIVVSLPAEAKLFVDGVPTQSTSNVRTFVSPPIEPNKDFQYTLKAELPKDGRTQTATREVTVRAGQETNVVLNFPTGEAAR
jgi:uncharacterized protein (TIGR03000 family)